MDERASHQRDELRQQELAELHDDDIRRQAIRVNNERWEGRYCCLVPDPDVAGRWTTIAAFKSLKQAQAFALGYEAHRDGRGPEEWQR